MTLPRRQLIGLAGAAVGAAILPLRAWSQPLQLNYPTRPVRVIVTFAPGGTVDVFTRIVAQKLSERLGKQFYVENVAGATGNIGTGQAAKAVPDGHTILFAFSSFVVNPSLFAQVPYDPSKSFEPMVSYRYLDGNSFCPGLVSPFRMSVANSPAALATIALVRINTAFTLVFYLGPLAQRNPAYTYG